MCHSMQGAAPTVKIVMGSAVDRGLIFRSSRMMMMMVLYCSTLKKQVDCTHMPKFSSGAAPLNPARCVPSATRNLEKRGALSKR